MIGYVAGATFVRASWWGNYEIDTDGNEIRGSGIEHFHLSVHMCGGGDPWCLPMEPEMYGFDVPCTGTMEQPTGMVNNEGSAIYYYEFELPFPLPQEPMMHYWFDITAISIDAVDPPMWRWQEANRSSAFFGWAPAAEKAEPPFPGAWHSITWPNMTFSDMAFELVSAALPGEEPNRVVADDFISDGRPIEALRWWGSYFDDIYAPNTPWVEPYVLDGWLISFHHAMPDEPNPPQTDPTVLGVYFAPRDSVTITGPLYLDCHGHEVFEYEVDLSRCCLLCSETDPRNGMMPAREGVFAEFARHKYWLDIQALVGITWLPDSEPSCFPIVTGHMPSPETAEGHFWGWHTSMGPVLPGDIPTENASAGRIVDFAIDPEQCWVYGEWEPQWWQCEVPPPPEVNMAFEVLTSAPVPSCPYDLDMSGFVGVGDINLIKANYGPCPYGVCKLYDVDDSDFVGVGDINLVKANYGPCPDGACWYDDGTGINCVDTFESDCLSSYGGDWLGAGTYCP